MFAFERNYFERSEKFRKVGQLFGNKNVRFLFIDCGVTIGSRSHTRFFYKQLSFLELRLRFGPNILIKMRSRENISWAHHSGNLRKIFSRNLFTWNYFLSNFSREMLKRKWGFTLSFFYRKHHFLVGPFCFLTFGQNCSTFHPTLPP